MAITIHKDGEPPEMDKVTFNAAVNRLTNVARAAGLPPADVMIVLFCATLDVYMNMRRAAEREVATGIQLPPGRRPTDG